MRAFVPGVWPAWFRLIGAVGVLGAAATLACLGDSNANQSPDGGTVDPEASDVPASAPVGAVPLTFSVDGLSSTELTVRTDGALFYSNTDSAPHQPSSTPNPARTDCPFLNAPVLMPGDTFAATVTGPPGDCHLYDFLFPDDPRLLAVIHVVPAPLPGATNGAADGGIFLQ